MLAGPTVPHRESCDGSLTSVVNPTPQNPVGSMTFLGKGVATHMGKYQITGGHTFRFNPGSTTAGTLNGTFKSTAADGSTIAGIYFGTFAAQPNNTIRFDVTAVYQVGTRRLLGVTGRGAVVAILDAATGNFHYDTLGTWTFP